jgi:hypothetical protein
MSDTNYTLEWRGTKKSGFSYADIEAALATGDLHSLYKINVDGRWVVLRDFVEQQRAAAKRSAPPVLQEPTYPQQVAPSPYSPPAPVSYPVTSYAAPAQQVALPPLPLHEGMPHGYQMPHSFQEKAQKPVWFWPVIITSATVCILMAIVTVYVIATRQSTPSYGSSNSNGSSVANNTSGSNSNSPANGNSSRVGNGNSSATAKDSASGSINSPANANGNSSAMSNSGATVADAKPEPKPEAKLEAKPEPKPEVKSAQVKFQPYSFTGKEIFPSALISTATVDWNGDAQNAEDKKTEDDAQLRKREVPIYGDENSWLGFELSGLSKGAQVSVEITSEGMMMPSKWQGPVTTVSQKGRALISPKIMWNYEVLTKIRQQRPININFSATVYGAELPVVNETYTLRSINDCPLYVSRSKSSKGSLNDSTSLSFLFAAYVNENHPQVQEVLKEALGCRIVDKFDGYLSADPKQVYLQVFSIWNALQRRGIKYSNVAATTPGDKVFSQSVRFLDQSINDHQANCVDGSVLMASVLHKIGIKSYLVIIPGHCFLAFDLTPNSAALPIGLETTMLGKNEITDVKNLAYLPKQEKFKEYEDSYKTFGEAVETGSDTIQGSARLLQSQSDVRFRLVSIEDERNFGIMPIPFTLDK